MSDDRHQIPTVRPGDQPITSIDQDAMEWKRHIHALLRTIERAETPFVLGVYGGWGSGKTSFVNCLADVAEAGNYSETPNYEWLVLKVNPWECDTPEDAKRLITSSLWAYALTNKPWYTWSGLRQWLRRAGRRGDDGAAGVLDTCARLAGIGPLGSAVQKLLGSDAGLAAERRHKFRQDLALALGRQEDGTYRRRLLVVIDDLDRCRSEVIPEVLETVKLYLDQEGCVFVLAADPIRIGQVLGEAYATKDADGNAENANRVGKRFLEKIVQLPFWVPRMSPTDADSFFSECACMLHPEVPVGKEMRKLLLDHLLQRNPRSIKRFCITHGLLAQLQRDVNGDKLAKILAIDWYFPRTYESYASPGDGASLLLKHQRDARGDTEDVAGRDLLEKTLKVVLAEDPPFGDEEDVERYFQLTGEARVPGDMTLPEALAQLASDHGADRFYAVRRVRDIGGPEALVALLEMLADPDSMVQEEAILALPRFGDTAVSPLVERLEDDRALVREGAARALGLLGDRRGVDPLIERLTDPSPRVRRAAAEALVDIGDERALQSLTECLEDDDARVRYHAVWGVAKIGSESAKVQAKLRDAKDNDEDDTVRDAAKRAIAGIADGPDH